MALSSYYRQYDAQNLDALNQQKQIINQTADASIKMIEDAGNAQIKEAEHAYDGVINTANVQKLINERAVAERMSNMGLTDSGLNRTQQTAIELSRSNAVNSAMVARQKQIDALALAISQQVGQINIERNTDIMNADLTYNANKNSWASSMYDADQQAAASRYKAQLDYDAKMAQMQIDAENERLDARDKLIEKIYDDDISDEAKMSFVDNYRLKYGRDEEIANMMTSLGITTAKQYDSETGQYSSESVNPKTNTSWLNSDVDSSSYRRVASQEEVVNAAQYKRAEGESDYNFAQRVADESFLETTKGKKVVAEIGRPKTNLSAAEKKYLEDKIYDLGVTLKLTDAQITSLYRSYL